MAKARRGRGRSRPAPDPDAAPPSREHWRSDGVPKTAFGSIDEASRSALQARLERGADLDPYQCRLCGSWHLGNRRA